MELVALGHGKASLEFSPEEKAAVFDSLREVGPPEVEVMATYVVFTIGSIELLHEDEWDDPCLIASTPAGVALLERVEALSNAGQGWRKAS